MRKIKKTLIISIFLLSTIFTTGCIFVRETLEDKIDFEGFWKCEEYNLTLDLLAGKAYMITDNETYYYRIVFGDAGNSICFYDDLYSIKEWDNCAYGEDMLFNCVPNISIKKDSFTLKIGDCKKEEFANKTLKFIHLTRDDIIENNRVYEKLNNNSKWVSQEENIQLEINGYANLEKIKINDLEYSAYFSQDWKSLYICDRYENQQLTYGFGGICEVIDCDEGIKLNVVIFYDESLLKTGDIISLLPENE